MTSRLGVVTLLAITAACGKSKDTDKGTASEPAPPPTADKPPAPPPSPSAPPPTAPADPYAQGYCEYTIDGGAPNKGGGGLNNVLSVHWMAADQKGRSLATPLLINCGKGGQINLMSHADSTAAAIPFGPKKYAIGKTNKLDEFAVLGPNFMGGMGELDVTAWDRAHIAGTFQFEAQGKKYAGKFDIKCPFPGNGICQ